MSTICMKLDPGMHIGLHLVFFGKAGVTVYIHSYMWVPHVIAGMRVRIANFFACE
jgi:hypothetical protein